MAKAVAASLVFCFLAGTSYAGPANETRRDVLAARQHDYWLSNGLSRLAFWQSSRDSRPESRR